MSEKQPTEFEKWLDGSEGQMALDRTFRTGQTRLRTEALAAAFTAGQRSEHPKVEALHKEVCELRDLCANSGIKV